MSWILEDNRPMRHIIESLGARAYKSYRSTRNDRRLMAP